MYTSYFFYSLSLNSYISIDIHEYANYIMCILDNPVIAVCLK